MLSLAISTTGVITVGILAKPLSVMAKAQAVPERRLPGRWRSKRRGGIFGDLDGDFSGLVRQRLDRLPDLDRLAALDEVADVLQIRVRAGDEDTFFASASFSKSSAAITPLAEPAVVANEGVDAILVLDQQVAGGFGGAIRRPIDMGDLRDQPQSRDFAGGC
jgi:hypothetical protein